ncbi:MAG: flagellar hook-associated protein FlgK [Bdellovibrio sp.]|jgi:flagellar hook-associated protein 1 FlgK
MAKIHAMMDIGKRSMLNSQTALQTVSHNIANKTTEGYSRQRVDTVTAPPIQEGRLQLGMGARASQVSRVNNPFLEKQIQNETGSKGFLQGQADALSRVEQVFNEQLNKGLSHYVSDFFNAYRELSNNPESTTTRTAVKEAAEAMTADFKRVDDQLTTVQKDIDIQVQAGIVEINAISKEIATLNKDIVQVEMQGIPANDQRDRRDFLVKQLHEKIDVRVAEGDRGAISVSTAGNALLVSGLDHTELVTYSGGVDNRVQIYARPSEAHPPFLITDRIKGGTLGGVIKVRDTVIDSVRERVDSLAYKMAGEVNDAHRQGFDRTGKPTGFFFDPMGGVQGAAKAISVTNEISNDVNRIATAAKTNAPGDGSIANVISMIQFKEVMDGDTATMNDFYNAQVGRVGVMAQTAVRARDAQDNILLQVTKLRESVSGVSLDEEATKMLEFQKTFDASARLIRTADEMFDTVLNLKRM